MFLTKAARRYYSTSRQVGRCLQISDGGQIAIPTSSGQNVVYTLNMSDTIKDFQNYVVENSFSKINDFQIVNEDIDQESTVDNLVRNGKFDIKIDGRSNYTVYPDYSQVIKQNVSLNRSSNIPNA